MSDITKNIQKAASSSRQDTAEILSKLVKIQSYSGEEEKVCRLIEGMCIEAGFDEVRIDGLGSVIARVGNGPKVLAFDAHVDTVTVGDESQWTMDPFSGLIMDGLVHGRGSSDQKGGAAAMIAAGKILKGLDYNGDHSVYFTFTVLEEDCDGLCWKYLIEEEGLRPDYAVSTEPTSCRLYRGHRGRMEMEAVIRGVSAHGSAPERGSSAAYKAARAALAMESLNAQLEPDEFLGKGTVVVSQMNIHGPSQCAVPDQGRLYLDRRLTWGETADMALQQVRDCMGSDLESVSMPLFEKKGWQGIDYGQELYFPTWKIPEDHPLVRAGADTYSQLYGKQPEIGKWTFSTNCVAICGRHQIPCIGFGPGDENQAHAPNEHTRIDDLVTCSAVYAALPYVLDKDMPL
ncbi:MAG: YgeY family selenium metabolism-linked hydrolase [Spirochaetales bacterium]|jgi:putative selenium metabolism hydrolase|nr:YgeY family selenium metabolism-linked hydrolase [Spirochaetales bacterium]